MGSGDIIRISDIAYKRTNTNGLSPQDVSKYIGMKLLRSKNTDDILTKNDFL
jgi:sialic acid synthase SpsE